MMQLLTTSCFLLLNMVIGQSLAQVTLIRCERTLQTFWETNLALACTGSDVLDIQAGNFGRTSATVCPGAPGSVTNVVDCVEPATLEVMRDACHGESTCVLEPTTDFFTSTACPAVYKYVNVTYQCGPAPTPPAAPCFQGEVPFTHGGTSAGDIITADCTCVLGDYLLEESFPYVISFDGTSIQATLDISATQKRQDVHLVSTAREDGDPCRFEAIVTMKRNTGAPPAKVDIVHFRFGYHQNPSRFARHLKYIKKSHRLVENSPDLEDSVSYPLPETSYSYSDQNMSAVARGTVKQGFQAHSPECGWVLEYFRLPDRDLIQVAINRAPVVGMCGSM